MEVAEKICSRILVIDHGREVISGSLADIKSRYGHNSVAVEFDGTIDFESLSGLVRRRVPIPPVGGGGAHRGRESPGPSEAPVDQVSVRRFEVVSPSLHRIFVELVGGAAKGGEERMSG